MATLTCCQRDMQEIHVEKGKGTVWVTYRCRICKKMATEARKGAETLSIYGWVIDGHI
jgi:hypothetical protein